MASSPDPELRMTDEDVQVAWATLKKMCVKLDATHVAGYQMVAEKYGLTPRDLRDKILELRKKKYRTYMRAYMRRRRGTIRERVRGSEG